MVAAILAKLEADAEDISRDWNAVVPGTETRFCAIDNLLPTPTADEICAAFPQNAEGFYSRASFCEHKRTSSDFDSLPRVLGDITFAMQAPALVQKIGELTGMEQLKPETSLYAGGLSMMFKDEFLVLKHHR